MNEKQIELVRDSFSVATQRTDVTSDFYEKLFSSSPEIRSLFPPDMSRQQEKMADSLSLMVKSLDRPGALATMLVPLGRRHGPYNVTADMLSPVIGALKATVHEITSDLWDDEIDVAWDAMTDLVCGMFLTGLEQSRAKNDDTPEILMQAQVSASSLMHYSQVEIDKIVEAIFIAGFNNRVRLARLAVEETGMGRVDSKVYKNVLATLMVWQDIKDVQTVGCISSSDGLIEIAQPMGVVLGVIPVTNPTSTTFYKIISAIKARNSIIITGASRAANCTNESARIAYDAALAAGAPVDCIQWVDKPNRQTTQNLMSQPDVAIILATGGEGLVSTAYSSGTPAFGVGSGNVPVLIDDDFDMEYAAKNIVDSKNFDFGTICASEQSIICTERASTRLIEALEKYKAYILSKEEIKLLEMVAINEKGSMHPDIVGKPAHFIAKQAKIEAPKDVSLLVAPLDDVGKHAPLSQEILAPIIALYVESNMIKALTRAAELNHFGGVGHTAAIYSDDKELIEKYGSMMNAGRILVNVPSSGGACGIGTMLTPSLTLGCGTSGGNITTKNISARDLVNIQRVALPQPNQNISKLSDKDLMDANFLAEDAQEILKKRRL